MIASALEPDIRARYARPLIAGLTSPAVVRCSASWATAILRPTRARGSCTRNTGAALFTGHADIQVAVVIWTTLFGIATLDAGAIVATAAVTGVFTTNAGSIRACLAFGAGIGHAKVILADAAGCAHIWAVTILAAAAGSGIGTDPSGRPRTTTKPTRWTTEVSAAHVGRTVLVERTADLFALAGDACAVRTASLVCTALDAVAAAFAGDRTELARIRTTKLLAIAMAIATGVVTTFAMADSDSGRVATGRTALTQARGADARPAAGKLIAGTAYWCGRGIGWATGRVGVAVQQGATCQGRSAKAKQPLEDRPAARSGGK